MNQRNEPGTNGHRYLAYLKTVADQPVLLRAVDLPRLFDDNSMPPSIRMAKRDFWLWLQDETLSPRVRAALEAMAGTIDGA